MPKILTNLSQKLTGYTNKDFPALSPLFWVMLLDHISVNITFPVLTFVFFSKDSSLFPATEPMAIRSLWYGMCLSLPHFAGIVSTPLMSIFSDWIGRRRTLFIACMAAFIFAISCMAGILMSAVVLLLMGKIIGGLFSRTNPMAQAVVADVSSDGNQAENQGYLQVIISLGAFIGPILGGFFAHRFWFSHVNYAGPYILAALFSAFAAVSTLLYFKESYVRKAEDRPSIMAMLAHLKNRKILYICLLLVLSQIAWSFYYQFMPPLLKHEVSYSVQKVGFFVGVTALWLMLASGFVVKIFQKRYSRQQFFRITAMLLLCGTALTLLAFVAGYLWHTTWLIWLAAIPTAMGDVLFYILIVTEYSKMVPASAQGFVMGLCFLIISLTWAVTALLGGILLTLNFILPLVFSVFASLALLVLVWRFKNEPQEMN